MNKDDETKRTVTVWRAYIALIVTAAPIIFGAFAWSVPAKVREIVAVEVSPVNAQFKQYLEIARYEREQAEIKMLLQKLDSADKESRDKAERNHNEIVELIHQLDKKIK